MERPSNVSEALWAELVEPTQKRKYEPANQCPHIKVDGERCGAGVMSGSAKCATHSGMTSAAVRQKRRVNLIVAKYAEKGSVEGDEGSTARSMQRARSAVERAADDIAEDIGDAPLSSDDTRFRDWLALTKEAFRMNADMTRLGQTDRALDAAEVMALPAWIALEDAITEALRPFPEARSAVFAALAASTPQPAPIVVVNELEAR